MEVNQSTENERFVVSNHGINRKPGRLLVGIIIGAVLGVIGAYTAGAFKTAPVTSGGIIVQPGQLPIAFEDPGIGTATVTYIFTGKITALTPNQNGTVVSLELPSGKVISFPVDAASQMTEGAAAKIIKPQDLRVNQKITVSGTYLPKESRWTIHSIVIPN